MTKIVPINNIMLCSLLCLFSATALASDGKTTFQYEHNWKSMDRRHGDTLKLIHKTSSNWQFEFKFGTSAGGGSNYDVAFDDMQGGSGGFVIQKGWDLPNGYGTLTPSYEMTFGKNNTLFQPGLKYGYKINKEWSTSLRYRYEWKKISQSERYKTAKISSKPTVTEEYIAVGDVGRHRLDWNMSYSGFSMVSLSYTFNYYIGDYTNTPYKFSGGKYTELQYKAFNDKKTDYEQQLKLTWNYSKQLRPYFEIDDVSTNTYNDTRQAKFKVGFNYTF